MPRISELPATAAALLEHNVPASWNGETHRLALFQIRELFQYLASEIGAAGDMTVQEVLDGLATSKADASATSAALAELNSRQWPLANLADLAAARVLGQPVGGSGAPKALTAAQVKAVIGLLANADLANMAANTIKGRLTSDGVAQDLTVAQALGLLGFAGSLGSSDGRVNVRLIFPIPSGQKILLQAFTATVGTDTGVTYPVSFKAGSSPPLVWVSNLATPSGGNSLVSVGADEVGLGNFAVRGRYASNGGIVGVSGASVAVLAIGEAP